MGFALNSSALVAVTGANEGGLSPRFPRPAHAEAATTAATVVASRTAVEPPPQPEVFEEQDAERWDGMA